MPASESAALGWKIRYVSSARNPGSAQNQLSFPSCNTGSWGPGSGVWDMDYFLQNTFTLLVFF